MSTQCAGFTADGDRCQRMTKSKTGYCCPAHENAGDKKHAKAGGKKPVRTPPAQRRHEYVCDNDSDDDLLEGMKTMTLYHQTTAAGGSGIKASGGMRPGSRGMYGAGIYFAETQKQTIGKAIVDPNETRLRPASPSVMRGWCTAPGRISTRKSSRGRASTRC